MAVAVMKAKPHVATKTEVAKRKPAAKATRPATRHTKWLVISSGKGGSGKSTLTRNLAVHASHGNLKVATLDLDGQRSLTSWIDVRPHEAPKFFNLAMPLQQISSAFDAMDRMPDLDLVIVDTPPGVNANPVEMRQLIQRADYVLVPSGMGASDLRSVIEWMRFIRREDRKGSFVLNLTKRNTGSYDRAKLELQTNGELCPFDIRDLEAVRISDLAGIGVLEMRGVTGLSDFQGLWQYVINKMGLKVT